MTQKACLKRKTIFWLLYDSFGDYPTSLKITKIINEAAVFSGFKFGVKGSPLKSHNPENSNHYLTYQ